MDVPSLVCIDFETSDLNTWKDDFIVISCAFKWGSGNYYTDNIDKIRHLLVRFMEAKTKLIAHNISYEISVVQSVWPDISLNWYADTMRMTQMYDNGNPNPAEEKLSFYKLTECVNRILPQQYWNHKEKFHKWIRENVTLEVVKQLKKGNKTVVKNIPRNKEGSYIDRLPKDLLKEYNLADVEVTWELYQKLDKHFKNTDIDYRIDHDIWLPAVKLIVDAKIRGIKVDKDLLDNNLKDVIEAQSTLKSNFREKYLGKITEIETEQGVDFNPQSTKQLAKLFIDKLGMEAKIKTKPSKLGKGGGSPSFSAKHLFQYGEAGKCLAGKGSLLQLRGALETLQEKIQYDGLYHMDLKTVGTRTGRYAGSGGLNITGQSRRKKGFFDCILPDEDNILISQDLISGEPTLISIYSRDPNYMLVNFGMVGKEPYYKDNILYTDSTYVTLMSAASIWKDKVKDLFYNQKFEGLSFADMWLKDSDYIKKEVLKQEYPLAKAEVLGLGYGAGAQKLQDMGIEHSYTLTKVQAKEFKDFYWYFFNGVRQFNDRCVETVKNQGFIQNEFGYINYPLPKNAMNAFIQSTVSGFMNLYAVELSKRLPEMKFVTFIHDEVIYQLPDDAEVLNRARQTSMQVVEEINELMGWTDIKMRMGFNTGYSILEAK